MTHGRKPRRPRWAHTGDTFGLASHYAQKISPEEISHVMAPMLKAFAAMRTATASEQQWAQIDHSISLAQTIEAQGVVRGLSAHLAAAKQASLAIYQRSMQDHADARTPAGQWQPTALYFGEIEALQTHTELHEFQLQHLSRGELRKAVDKTISRVQSTSATIVVHNPCSQAALSFY